MAVLSGYEKTKMITPRPVVGGLLRLLQCGRFLPCDVAQHVWRLLPVDVYLAAHYLRNWTRDTLKPRLMRDAFNIIKEYMQHQRVAEDTDTENPMDAILEMSPYRTSETIWDLYFICDRHANRHGHGHGDEYEYEDDDDEDEDD